MRIKRGIVSVTEIIETNEIILDDESLYIRVTSATPLSFQCLFKVKSKCKLCFLSDLLLTPSVLQKITSDYSDFTW